MVTLRTLAPELCRYLSFISTAYPGARVLSVTKVLQYEHNYDHHVVVIEKDDGCRVAVTTTRGSPREINEYELMMLTGPHLEATSGILAAAKKLGEVRGAHIA